MDRASTFVIALLIAHRRGATGLGTFTAAMAFYGVFAIAGQAGTTTYLVREISRDRTRTASYVVHVTVVAIVVSVVLIAGLEAIVPHLGYSPALRSSTAIIVLAVLGTVLNSIQEAVFLAYGRVEFETLATFVSSVFYIAIGVILLARGHGVPALMWTYVALEYAVTLAYFVLISRYIVRLRFSFRPALAVRLMGEMKAFTASSALAALFARPEVVILSLLASARQVGYYGAAIRVAELPMFVPEVFMANVFTLLSRAFGHDEKRFREIQVKAVRSMLAFALPLAALMFAAAPAIIVRLYGTHFHPSVLQLRILAFNVVFVSLMSVFWRSLAARERQGTVVRVQILMVGLRVGVGAALIAALAALGAAIATAANSLLQVTLLVAAAARSGAPAPIIRNGWRLALAAAVTCAVTWFVSRLVPVWLALLAGATIYVASVVVFGAVSADDRELLARLRQRRA